MGSESSGIGAFAIFIVIGLFFGAFALVSNYGKNVQKKKKQEEIQKMQRVMAEEEFTEKAKKPVQKPVTVTQRRDSLSSYMGGAVPHAHTHPSELTGTFIRKELAYTENSAGGDITEGCLEHYNERLIAEDMELEDISDHCVVEDIFSFNESSDTNEELLKSMILGDILNTPRYKNSYKR